MADDDNLSAEDTVDIYCEGVETSANRAHTAIVAVRAAGLNNGDPRDWALITMMNAVTLHQDVLNLSKATVALFGLSDALQAKQIKHLQNQVTKMQKRLDILEAKVGISSDD